MKVIEKGATDWTQHLKCKGCSAVLEIDWQDLQYEVTEAMTVAQQYSEDIKGQYFVVCMECEQKLVVKSVPPIIEKKVQRAMGRII